MYKNIRYNIARITYLAAIILSLCATTKLLAVPAKPGTVTVTQADGSQIKVQIKGDEYFRWRTTESGYPITKGADGYYYYAKYHNSGSMERTEQRVSVKGVMQAPPADVTPQQVVSVAQSAGAAQRTALQSSSPITRSSSDSYSGFPSEGEIRSIVILVEYADVRFTVDNPNQAFYNQLNEEGYSVEGATGSARDYFSTSSKGLFDGQFDVFGPYTLSNNRSYYGENDSSTSFDARPDEMVAEAAALADAAGVDFSQYDLDDDGYIDNIFVYYAGLNEAESAIEDSVWPHKWVVSSKPEFDGKKLYVYACTSELRGDSGTTIAGIGTFCHEFSHVFGLADHYDTTAETDGESYGLGFYDIMTYGSYNNDGNTPPLHNGLELFMIGWNTPIEFETSQEITIEPISRGNVYKVATEVENEYFLLEVRDQNDTDWDRYITADGLFISHVDMSDDYLSKWSANAPNGDLSHECFRFIVSGNTTMSYKTESQVPYPYRNNTEWHATSSPAALSWGGEELGVSITNITKNTDGSVTLYVTTMQELSGTVTDEDGTALWGATLNFVCSDGLEYSTTTDRRGSYSIELPEGTAEVEITCSYYQSHCEIITIEKGSNSASFQITSLTSLIDQIEVSEEQTQATVKWDPQEYTSFMITLDGEQVAIVEDAQYVITGLTPATLYTVGVSVEVEENQYTELYSSTFTTIAQVSDVPMVMIDGYSFDINDVIELKTLNTLSDDVISWVIDGSAVTLSKLTFSEGRHVIQAIVVRGDKTYRANKIINVGETIK